MYGVSLRYKKPLIAAMAGGGAGGLFLGIMNVGRYAQVAPGIFALPSFIGADGLSNFIYACIGSALAFVVAFIISYILGIEEPIEETAINEQKKVLLADHIIYSPLKGTHLPLSQVNDSVFASGSMGQGTAIVPNEGKLYAPVDGTISMLFPTCHAIGIQSDNGAEILIHIGMDTVELKGEHFKTHIQQGAAVKKGDLLIEFDLQAIKQQGYDVTTPIILTNTAQFSEISITDTEMVSLNTPLLKVKA